MIAPRNQVGGGMAEMVYASPRGLRVHRLGPKLFLLAGERDHGNE